MCNWHLPPLVWSYSGRVQPVQKALNQELFSIRFAAVKDFVTDLVVFGGAARMNHRMFWLGQSWGHLWDALHSPCASQRTSVSWYAAIMRCHCPPELHFTLQARSGASNLQPPPSPPTHRVCLPSLLIVYRGGMAQIPPLKVVSSVLKLTLMYSLP